MRFIISRHVGLDGVRLSKPGHFTNLPFPDDASADAFAVAHARRKRQQARVVRETFRRIPHAVTMEA